MRHSLGDMMCLGLLESIEQSNGTRVGEMCLNILNTIQNIWAHDSSHVAAFADLDTGLTYRAHE